ncbi:MAG TPA: hypothetical protein VJG64_04915 [Candidatus Paceibacterota bacterium]
MTKFRKDMSVNPDSDLSGAEAKLYLIEDHDPRLLEAIREWQESRVSKFSALYRPGLEMVFFGGAITSYDLFMRQAKAKSRELPSHTRQDLKPTLPQDGILDSGPFRHEAWRRNPEFLQLAERMGNAAFTMAEAAPLVFPKPIVTASVLLLSALSCYAALKEIGAFDD